ncbi:MAG: ribonuclease E/G [Rhodospirillales bacterium]|nr:ribonuclease E/G [Rhodospirillales bacterium]
MPALNIIIDERNGALWAAAVDSSRRLFALECDTPREEIRWGSIFLGKVETIDRKLDACWVSLGDGRMGLMPRKEWTDPNIDPQSGDLMIVQAKTGVTQSTIPAEELDLMRKVKIEPKVTRLSTDITLAGRYLIFAVKEADNRLSRRVRDRATRRKMMNMIEMLADDLQGCILRAAAESVQTDILKREGLYLQSRWTALQKKAKTLTRPQELERGPNAIERMLSDMAGRRVDSIEVALLEHLSKAESWCEIFAPDLMTKIVPIELANATDDFALFEHYDLQDQIEDLLQPYVLLPDGGNLILQETAALLAIDINRGGDQRNSNMDLNIEAAHEIGRQLRLRNLGGIILIDFLKGKTKADEGRLIAAMEDAVATDACTVQIHGMTALGLMELTRQRRLPTLRDRALGVK